nr:Chain G, LEDGF peptide [Homo sapiens]3AVN_H Chain H, LEDGF peptide [Homo sapiens]
SHKIDNLD